MTTLADEIAARAEALSRLADGTARQIAAELMPLAGRVKTLEQRLDEIVENCRQDAQTASASSNVVNMRAYWADGAARKWRGQ
jgi:hypothetical protein